jgi:NAD kinase
MDFERIIIIRDKTRLEQLIERFNSKAQAKFYLERSGEDFDYYVTENHVFYQSLAVITDYITGKFKFKIIDRSFLSTYMFTDHDLVIVLGQDGLVANTAKYVHGLPIIGVNPDADRYDGVLLKHAPQDLPVLVKKIQSDRFQTQYITMAKATLNDGQELLAFNDFYIGSNSHVSSRYKLEYYGQKEQQSSSGVIVSTGAGSTGWLSSIYNMTQHIQSINHDKPNVSTRNRAGIPWNAEQLIFVVREPFLSKQSQIGLIHGVITDSQTLKIESHMPTKGVIFSDGIESDFIHFNSGSTVVISIADEKARLVV